MLLLFFSRFFHFATDQWNFGAEGSQIESPFGRKNVLQFPWVGYGHNIVSLQGFWSKGGVRLVVGNFLEQQIKCIYIFSEPFL